MSDLNHRDRTARKIPAGGKGFGAFLAGGGFGLFVTVPMALVGAVSGAIYKKTKSKKAEKKSTEQQDADEEDNNQKGGVGNQEGEEEENGPVPPTRDHSDATCPRARTSAELNRPKVSTSPGMLDV